MIMAMIRPETEMKDSGVKYIGLIPRTWKIVQLKYCTDCLDGKRVPIDASLRKSGIYPYWGAGRIMDYVDDYIFDERLVLLGEDGAPFFDDFRPVSHLIDGKVWVNNHIHVLRTKDNVVDSYLVHALNSVDYHEYINGSILNKLTQSNMNRIKIPLPSYIEQQAIADYLDETCSKIDEIIAEAKASIDEYKELKQSVIDKAVLHGLCNGMMKDSGNDLIGKIPLSWEMRKLKYVADFNPGITTAYDAQKEVGYVPMNCVKNGYMNPLSARLSDMSTGLTGFQDGDIVIAKVTPCFENGNIAVAENLEQGVAFGSSELFVIRTHSINRRFMLYYLQNSVFKNQCISTMTGTGGLKRVSGYFVNNAYITYPPENEQQVIVNYLDEAVKNMDSLISEKESLINDLEAYKKSLIYEVVTGKRKVV